MPHRLPAVLCLAALILAACEGSGTATTGISTTVSSETSAVAPPSTTTPAPSTTEVDRAAQLTSQIEELMVATSETRGLEFLSQPDITILTPAEVSARLRAELEEEADPEEFAADDALFTLLGLLEPDMDLLETFLELYSEGTLAFYDLETDELVTPATDDSLTPFQKFTLVHELTHALTDQHFDLYPVRKAMDDEQRYDEAAAHRALIEGDATLTQFLYLQEQPRAELLDALDEMLAIDTSVLNRAPGFLRAFLEFPYSAGPDFVAGLWAADGYAGLDDAYRDWPKTTEQVIDSSAFRDREAAVPVTLPSVTIADYDVVESSVWGQLTFQIIFGEVLDQALANQASSGWGGDAYQLHWDGGEVVLVLLYQGDTESDATEMQDALISYVTTAMNVGGGESDGRGKSFSEDDYAFVSRLADQVVFIAAGVPSDGEAARSAFPQF